jgi:signal transduction histidine kinase
MDLNINGTPNGTDTVHAGRPEYSSQTQIALLPEASSSTLGKISACYRDTFLDIVTSTITNINKHSDWTRFVTSVANKKKKAITVFLPAPHSANSGFSAFGNTQSLTTSGTFQAFLYSFPHPKWYGWKIPTPPQ